MIYATFSDFNARYATRLSADEVTSHYLPFASRRLEGLLSPWFSVPFSDNNLTAQDLTIDLAYLMLLQRSREKGDHQALSEALTRRLDALANGREAMVTTSGDALQSDHAGQVVWSNTARYRTVFDLRSSTEQFIDPDRLSEDT